MTTPTRTGHGKGTHKSLAAKNNQQTKPLEKTPETPSQDAPKTHYGNPKDHKTMQDHK